MDERAHFEATELKVSATSDDAEPAAEETEETALEVRPPDELEEPSSQAQIVSIRRWEGT